MDSFVCLAMRMRYCHWFYASIHQLVPHGRQKDINNNSGLAKLALVRGHAQLFNVHSIETLELTTCAKLLQYCYVYIELLLTINRVE